MYRAKRQYRKSVNRRAIAAVETAVCLPLLILVWFGSFELTKIVSLKQQAQFFASNAATQVMTTGTPLSDIELRVEELARRLEIVECDVTLTRINDEYVRSAVTIDYTANSPYSDLFTGLDIVSTYHSFRRQ